MDGGAPKDQSLHEETNKQELESTKGDKQKKKKRKKEKRKKERKGSSPLNLMLTDWRTCFQASGSNLMALRL